MDELQIDTLSVRLAGRLVLRDVSLRCSRSELVCIVGPNGAGKSSLLRAAFGLVAPDRGAVRFDGRNPRLMPARTRARLAAYLPQTRTVAWPMPVRDVVALGRYAFGQRSNSDSGDDNAAVTRALAACGLEGLADRSSDAISGGELARVHVARVLASEAPFILADEPVAALDPFHAISVLQTLRRFVEEGGAALVSIHDLSLAAQFADRVVMLNDGTKVADGAPAAVLTPERIAAVFGVTAVVGPNRSIVFSGHGAPPDGPSKP